MEEQNPTPAAESPDARFHTPTLFRFIFRLISYLVPPLAARLAAYLWCKPKRGIIKPEEAEVLARAEASRVDSDGRELAVYSWGEGPVVLLLHGWGSRASRLTICIRRVTVFSFRAAVHSRWKSMPWWWNRRTWAVFV